MQDFENRLTGGHPNSLGNTVEIVEEVLADEKLFDELFNCYFSDDEIVRLRVSNAMKRIGKEKLHYLVPYIDRFINEISKIDQASTKWTIAQLFEMLERELTATQFDQAKSIVKHNLETDPDWIVQNNSMQTLANWSKKDSSLGQWLIPHLERLTSDERKSVANRAKKLLIQLTKT